MIIVTANNISHILFFHIVFANDIRQTITRYGKATDFSSRCRNGASNIGVHGFYASIFQHLEVTVDGGQSLKLNVVGLDFGVTDIVISVLGHIDRHFRLLHHSAVCCKLLREQGGEVRCCHEPTFTDVGNVAVFIQPYFFREKGVHLLCGDKT